MLYKKAIFLFFICFMSFVFSVEKKSADINFFAAQGILAELTELKEVLPKRVAPSYQGLIDSQKENIQILNDKERIEISTKLMALKTKLAEKENLSLSESYLEKLNLKQVVCIHPNRLYYQILSNGDGSRTIQSTNDVIQCVMQISSIDGQMLYSNAADAMVKVFSLDELLPGIRIGLQGMREGEERELFIHPSFAYGSFSEKEPNMGFIVSVKLLQVLENNEENSEALDPLKIKESKETQEQLIQQIDGLEKTIAYDRGVRIGRHLNISKQINMKKLLDYMEQGHVIDDSSKEVQDALNTLHWEIYQIKSSLE